MKSLLQAGWLCTNAVGNIIVLIVAELGKLPKQVLHMSSCPNTHTTHIQPGCRNIPIQAGNKINDRIFIFVKHSFHDSLSCFLTQWAEYVLFASLLVAVSIIFSIMAYFYTYIDPAEIEAQIRKEQGLEPEETEKETLEMEEKDEDWKNEVVKQTKI